MRARLTTLFLLAWSALARAEEAATMGPDRPLFVPQYEFAPEYSVLVVIGLAMLFWGFYAAHESKPPLSYLGALSAPVGFIVAVTGALLICVPGFFANS